MAHPDTRPLMMMMVMKNPALLGRLRVGTRCSAQSLEGEAVAGAEAGPEGASGAGEPRGGRGAGGDEETRGLRAPCCGEECHAVSVPGLTAGRQRCQPRGCALLLSFAPQRSRLREDTHQLCSLLEAPRVCFHPSELRCPNARRLPAASPGDRSPSLPKYKETSLRLKYRAHPVAPSSACHLAAYGAALASNTFREVR